MGWEFISCTLKQYTSIPWDYLPPCVDDEIQEENKRGVCWGRCVWR